jgi:antitoxin component YwqK of YwqJK toxin-antitoxin module
MRIVTILLIIIPFLSFSQINQTDSAGLRQGLWEKKQPNGRLIYEGNFKDGKPIGNWKRYHTGGQVKAIIDYKQNSDSAITQIFDKFRKKVAEGIYVNQKKEGNWIYYSKNRKIAEEQFQNNLKNGTSLKYYNSGELMEEIDWINGNQEGKYQTYYKSGQPYLQCKMRQNLRHGLCLVYTQKGKLEMEANYNNNLRHGEWKFYNAFGEFQYVLKYNNGEILNPEVRDSIANQKLLNIEKGKENITDPEKFMEDPSAYMQKMKIYR